MTDIFDEVEGQLRTERYRALAVRAAPWVGAVLAAALVITLAIWGLGAYRTQASAKGSILYNAALETYRQGDTVKAFSQFGEVTKSGSPAYTALALMNQGGMRLEAGNVTEAVGFFDRAAGSIDAYEVSDMARLKSAFALMDTAPLKEIEARLTPLTRDKRPYRLAAKEALAFARLRAGQAQAARADFSALSLMLGVPDQMRQRSQLAVAFIDSGSASAIPAAVKAAIALPRALPMPPTALTGPPAKP